MADKFWVGGSNTWNATAGSKWATTSGGAGGAAVPGVNDDVFIDANSGAVTITKSSAVSIKSLNFTGFTGTFTGSGNLTLSTGSLTMGAGMTNTYLSGFFFTGTSSANITSNGISFSGIVRCNKSSGTLTLQDHFVSSTTLDLLLGTFDANNKNITTGSVSISTGGTLVVNMGSGTWTITTTAPFGPEGWSAAASGVTINPSTSTIVISDTGANEKSFTGGGLTYNNIRITGNNVTIVDSNTFNVVEINTAGLATGLKTTSGITITATSITTNGSSGNLAKSAATTGGSAATWSVASGVISLDYVNFTDQHASGGATFYAGSHSTDGGNNTGWTFTAPVTGYTMTAGAGSYALTGNSVNFLHGYKIISVSGSYLLTGNTVTLKRTYVISASVGGYNLTGTPVLLKYGRYISAASGSYALTGTSVSFVRTYILAASSGSYLLTGTAVALTRSYILSATTGTYSWTGTAVTLVYTSVSNYNLIVDAGSYSFTGNAVTFRRAYKLTSNSGSYSLTGNSVNLKKGYALPAGVGSYSITGNTVTLVWDQVTNYTMPVDVGHYLWTGFGTGAPFRIVCDIDSEICDDMLVGSSVCNSLTLDSTICTA